MFDFIHEEAMARKDKANTTSIILILVIICLGNLVFALSSESFAQALDLLGQF